MAPQSPRLPLALPPLAYTPSVLQGVWALSTLPPPADDGQQLLLDAGLDGLAHRVADEAAALGQLAYLSA
ncbi:MAG: hypothetical protein KKA73_07890 [Chloroflexi bacterium]|nr:hypothetical protein [Chloroflexota bacterium]MBU1747594.1 hypothetical protein [Chloroflexota bacterium]